MRTSVLVVLCASLAVLAGPTRAYAQSSSQDHIVELGVVFWRPSPELRLTTGRLSRAGIQEVDFVGEFGIEDRYFPELRATLGRAHKFRTSFVTFGYTADTTIAHTITWNGRTFDIGVPATGDVNWKLYKFGYEWDVVSRERGFFGVVADLKYNRVEASIDSPVLTSAAATAVTAVVPAIGVVGRAYLGDAVSVTGEFTGLNFTRRDDEVTFFDFDLYGTVGGRNFAVQGGYRSVVVDYLFDDDAGALKMKGLYVGALTRF